MVVSNTLFLFDISRPYFLGWGVAFGGVPLDSNDSVLNGFDDEILGAPLRNNIQVGVRSQAPKLEEAGE